jgi:hypothetical protein
MSNKKGGEEKPYSVTLWGTHPDKGEDTCSTGMDFATLAEARACYENPDSHFPGISTGYFHNTPYVMIDGPNVNETRRRPGIKDPRPDNDDDWKREQAMQAGMAFGCDGYNEAMGYD